MSLDPLLDAGLIVVMHAVAALLCVGLGGMNLLLQKGTVLHIWVGRSWVSLMALVAVSSFWIQGLHVIGRWSPIHLLSILTLGTLVYSFYAIRTGNVEGHKHSMRSLYLFALLIAGAFTLVPGRVMYQVVTGG